MWIRDSTISPTPATQSATSHSRSTVHVLLRENRAAMNPIALVFCLLSLYFWNGQCSPVDQSTSTCQFRALVCNDGLQRRANSQRCLNVSEICNGVRDCQLGPDESNCDRDKFTVSNILVSSRDIKDDLVIRNISLEACAKFCFEEDQFQCIGFQHHLQSSDCRLLDSQFSEKSTKPSLRGFWITFQKNTLSFNKLPVIDAAAASFDNPDQNPDAFDDGFDAVVVEANFDAAPPSEAKNRKRRQINSLFPTFRSFRGDLFKSSTGCGLRSIDFEPRFHLNRAGRIINGDDAPLGAYPWQAAIKLKDGNLFRQWCGGAIISDLFILTAAHCIDHLRRNEFVVVVGANNTQIVGPEQQMFEVDQFITHYNYHASKKGSDIALIKLKNRIAFGNHVQSICLPTSDSPYKSPVANQTMCNVSGWGLKKAGDQSSQSEKLQVASVPLMPEEVCKRKDVYGDQASDGMVCAGYLDGGIDACRGDSGGPLACKIDGQYQLLGVVSWGDGCAAKNKPGVYTKVFYYLNWIQEWSRKL